MQDERVGLQPVWELDVCKFRPDRLMTKDVFDLTIGVNGHDKGLADHAFWLFPW